MKNYKEFFENASAQEIVSEFKYDLFEHFIRRYKKYPELVQDFSDIFSFASFGRDANMDYSDMTTRLGKRWSKGTFASEFQDALAEKYGFRPEKIYPLEDFLI